MPKKPDETYLEYKRRVIDPLSPTFCASKWLNATIWLNSGTTASCHHPPAHRIDPDEIEQNPRALHNTRHKKLMRKLMQNGEQPSECDYCWRVEAMGSDAVSDRVYKTVIYDDEEIEATRQLPFGTDVNPRTLEIAFDRTCNFACSYCNASFSTTWAKDIKQNGPYQDMVSDGAAAFQHDGSWADPHGDDDNPYIKAFWAWWPELSQSLTELRITGGEPLMSTDVWKLFDFFEHNDSDMLFSINSNLGAKDDLIDRLIEKSHHIRHFDLYTSCEAYGRQAEYIRDGMEFARYVDNCTRICREANIRGFHMMMTINSLCLFSITEFLDLMLEWKRQFGRKYPTWSVNLLRFPSFMSPLALPDHIKLDRKQHLARWLTTNRDDPNMHEMEKEGLRRLIDYLELVDAPHRRTSNRITQWRDFKSFYGQYDRRRGKSLAEVFPPILVDWVESLPETKLPPQGMVDGDSTKGWHDDSELQALAEREGWILKPEGANPS